MTQPHMQKCFVLLDGRAITIQNMPVVAAEDFSVFLTSKELLETVQKDAVQYKQQIAEECEAIKEASYKEGFQAGFDQWLQTISALENQILTVHEELQNLIIPVAIKAAKKIVSSELEMKQDAILDIVRSVLKTVSQHKRVTLYVSHEDYACIESGKNDLKTLFEALEAFSVREKEDLKKGECIVETEGGIINARLEDRWRTLEVALQHVAHTVRNAKEQK